MEMDTHALTICARTIASTGMTDAEQLLSYGNGHTPPDELCQSHCFYWSDGHRTIAFPMETDTHSPHDVQQNQSGSQVHVAARNTLRGPQTGVHKNGPHPPRQGGRTRKPYLTLSTATGEAFQCCLGPQPPRQGGRTRQLYLTLPSPRPRGKHFNVVSGAGPGASPRNNIEMLPRVMGC